MDAQQAETIISSASALSTGSLTDYPREQLVGTKRALTDSPPSLSKLKRVRSDRPASPPPTATPSLSDGFLVPPTPAVLSEAITVSYEAIEFSARGTATSSYERLSRSRGEEEEETEDDSAASTTAENTPEASQRRHSLGLSLSLAQREGGRMYYRTGCITKLGARSENQDSYIAPAEPGSGAPCWGVFDGHGPMGASASQSVGRFVKRAVRQRIPEHLADTQQIELELCRILQEAHEQLLDTAKRVAREKQECGTTAVLAVLTQASNGASQLVVANVGDSRAILCRHSPATTDDRTPAPEPLLGETTEADKHAPRPPTHAPLTSHVPSEASEHAHTSASVSSSSSSSSSSSLPRNEGISQDSTPPTHSVPHTDAHTHTHPPAPSDGVGDGAPSMQCIPLSRDHTLSREDERARIWESGGFICTVHGTERVLPDRSEFPDLRLKTERLALNMTRSLGHLILSQYGVSSQPEFCACEVRGGDVLVLASDGLWDLLPNAEVARYTRLGAAQVVCRELSREVERRCKQQNKRMDNLTIVCVEFSSTPLT